MLHSRWLELMNDPEGRLTDEEMAEGYHWCWEWDDLLVGPDMREWGDDPKVCYCGIKIGYP